MSLANAELGPVPTDEAGWWYKDAGGSLGPVTASELGRLVDTGLLRRDVLVWTDGYGSHWKRFDDADARPDRGPPQADYGRWSKPFAKIEADPKARPRSLFGFFFGPFAYFRYGMWTKGLMIAATWQIVTLILIIAQDVGGTSLKVVPAFPLMIYCARNLKRDYYKFRVLGERVWPRFRRLDNVLALSFTCVALFLAIGFAKLANPVDSLAFDVAGVWESDDVKIFVDTADNYKTITYDGVSHHVEVRSVDNINDVIVFVDTQDPSTIMTFSKLVEGDKYSLDFRINDTPAGNFLYLRPN